MAFAWQFSKPKLAVSAEDILTTPSVEREGSKPAIRAVALKVQLVRDCKFVQPRILRLQRMAGLTGRTAATATHGQYPQWAVLADETTPAWCGCCGDPNDRQEPKPTCFCEGTNVSYAQQDLPSCIGGHGTVA